MVEISDEHGWVFYRSAAKEVRLHSTPGGHFATEYWTGPHFATEISSWTYHINRAAIFATQADAIAAWRDRWKTRPIPEILTQKALRVREETQQRFAREERERSAEEYRAARGMSRNVMGVVSESGFINPYPQETRTEPIALPAPIALPEPLSARREYERTLEQEQADWQAYFDARPGPGEPDDFSPGLLHRAARSAGNWVSSWNKPRKTVMEIFYEIFEDDSAQPKDPKAVEKVLVVEETPAPGNAEIDAILDNLADAQDLFHCRYEAQSFPASEFSETGEHLNTKIPHYVTGEIITEVDILGDAIS